MSRSNTGYYNVCDGPFNEEGYCEWHAEYHRPKKKCTPERKIIGRRAWERHKRFPDWTWKKYCSGPPESIKQSWRKAIRAKYKQAMLHQPEDPILMDGNKLMAGWYGWWS